MQKDYHYAWVSFEKLIKYKTVKRHLNIFNVAKMAFPYDLEITLYCQKSKTQSSGTKSVVNYPTLINHSIFS